MGNKQNLWPWTIITVLAGFLAALIAYVVFTTRHPVDLVSKDYYEREITYQDHLLKEERALDSDTAITVKYDSENKVLVFAAEGNPPSGSIPVTADFYRPSDSGLDRTVDFSVAAGQPFALSAQDIASGFWRVRLRWVLEEAECYKEHALFLD